MHALRRRKPQSPTIRTSIIQPKNSLPLYWTCAKAYNIAKQAYAQTRISHL